VKKTLFSIAFIAASGTYVAAANHLFALPGDDVPVAAANAAMRAPAQERVAPAASIVPPAGSPPQPTEPTVIVAEAAPAAPTAQAAQTAQAAKTAPSSIASAPLVAATTPIDLPPLPRPRPTPPTPALQPATSTAAADNGGLKDGTYTGSSENAYYGRVQVKVTVASHRIAAVDVLDYPKDRRTSRYINSQALPLLQQEVIAANSANVDTISGATLTSEAYLRSLNRALSQAGGASA
jgi:uncharacterized protein with FMN-binding domain